MKDLQMFIGGQWVDAVSGAVFEDYNPYDGELFARVPKGDGRDAELAMRAAHGARRVWAATSPGQRSDLLLKAATILENSGTEFSDVLTGEGGGTLGKVTFEIAQTVDLLRTAAGDCRWLLGQTFPTDPAKLSMTVYRPKGTVVAITPWNFPLILSMYKVAYALATGNTVVLKPASDTPVIGLKIAGLFEEAGLPPGVLNVVTGPGAVVGDALIDDDRCSCVTFTGQTATGRHIAGRAAAKLKEYTLELGGKDPLIILADADLDYAVAAAAFGAFLHQGEICMSVERVIVEEPVAEEFVERLAAKARTLPVGDPRLPATVVGPLINDGQVRIVDGQVKEAVAAGARLLCGGTYEGRVYRPTVLAGVTRGMKVFREETFGPVTPVTAARDEKEALAIANDTVYGLSSGIITRDLEKAMFLADGLEAGMVHVNDCSVDADASCPFGGCKASGHGREGGRHSIEKLSEVKWLTIQKKKKVFPF